jgi:hypothetical protein
MPFNHLKGAYSMMSPNESKNPIDRVTEIYVAIFPVQVFGEAVKAETILAGFQKDPDRSGMSRVRATIETHLSAVPDLVLMCDEILRQQEEVESYRLLKFDKEGIH